MDIHRNFKLSTLFKRASKRGSSGSLIVLSLALGGKALPLNITSPTPFAPFLTQRSSSLTAADRSLAGQILYSQNRTITQNGCCTSNRDRKSNQTLPCSSGEDYRFLNPAVIHCLYPFLNRLLIPCVNMSMHVVCRVFCRMTSSQVFVNDAGR